MTWVIPLASEKTRVLLIQAPYPGRSKFVGWPTSLLAAASRFCPEVRPHVGYLDAQWIDGPLKARVRQLCRSGQIRVACISTSTAAIGELATLAAELRQELGPSVLIVAGGPHEDDVSEKIASRIKSVDVSIAGDAEYALAKIVETFLSAGMTAEAFVRQMAKVGLALCPGRFSVTCAAYPKSVEFANADAADDAPGEGPVLDQRAHFSCFRAQQTIQLMLTRGCPYGQCTFCAEANTRYAAADTFDWVSSIVAENPGVALYFQDSIMPSSRPVRERLLPLLAEAGVEWGCQLYLPMASVDFIELLTKSGCTYFYTGLETADPALRQIIGKPPIDLKATTERMAAGSAGGARWGVSLMFGILDRSGVLAETTAHVVLAVEMAENLTKKRIAIHGFYPNVQTVLPKTAVDRGLRERGVELDYYAVPRVAAFDAFEDGGVGYNFVNLPTDIPTKTRDRHAGLLNDAAALAQSLGQSRW